MLLLEIQYIAFSLLGITAGNGNTRVLLDIWCLLTVTIISKLLFHLHLYHNGKQLYLFTIIFTPLFIYCICKFNKKICYLLLPAIPWVVVCTALIGAARKARVFCVAMITWHFTTPWKGIAQGYALSAQVHPKSSLRTCMYMFMTKGYPKLHSDSSSNTVGIPVSLPCPPLNIANATVAHETW